MRTSILAPALVLTMVASSAAAQSRGEPPVPAALAAAPSAKAAADAAIAKYGDLSRYYVIDASGAPGTQPAQCTAGQTLVDLLGADKDQGQTFTLFRAPSLRLDKATPGTTQVLATRTDGGRTGMLMSAYPVGMSEANAKEAFEMLNLPMARPTALAVLEGPALQASMNGVEPTTYRQCRGK